MIRRPNQDNVRKFLTYDSGQLERLLNEMATIIDTRTKKLDLLVETSNKDYVGMILGSNMVRGKGKTRTNLYISKDIYLYVIRHIKTSFESIYIHITLFYM